MPVWSCVDRRPRQAVYTMTSETPFAVSWQVERACGMWIVACADEKGRRPLIKRRCLPRAALLPAIAGEESARLASRKLFLRYLYSYPSAIVSAWHDTFC